MIEDAELIVDASLVTDSAAGVQDEGLRRPLRAELIGDTVFLVLEYGERDGVLLGVLGDMLGVVLAIGVDQQELHPTLGIGFVELAQAGHVLIVDRAFGPGKDDDDGFLVLETAKSETS